LRQCLLSIEEYNLSLTAGPLFDRLWLLPLQFILTSEGLS
jgi:hypothetical protein